jgi:hypothetical protein
MNSTTSKTCVQLASLLISGLAVVEDIEGGELRARKMRALGAKSNVEQ